MSSTRWHAIIINLCLPQCRRHYQLRSLLINLREQSPRWHSVVKYASVSSSFCFSSGWSAKCEAAVEADSIVPVEVLGEVEAILGAADSEAFAPAEVEVVQVRVFVGAAGV